VKDSSFDQCKASSYDGGFYVNGGSTTILNIDISSFEQCSDGNAGHSIYAGNCGCTFNCSVVTGYEPIAVGFGSFFCWRVILQRLI
jgi:hypothetical protein